MRSRAHARSSGAARGCFQVLFTPTCTVAVIFPKHSTATLAAIGTSLMSVAGRSVAGRRSVWSERPIEEGETRGSRGYTTVKRHRRGPDTTRPRQYCSVAAECGCRPARYSYLSPFSGRCRYARGTCNCKLARAGTGARVTALTTICCASSNVMILKPPFSGFSPHWTLWARLVTH